MTNTKAKIEDILFEHGLDYILESDAEEFASFAADMGMDIEELKLQNARAAEIAIAQHAAVPSTKPAKGLFARSLEKPVLTHTEKIDLLKRLMDAVKKLGFSCTFTMNDLNLFDDSKLEFHIAEFQSLLDENSHE